MSEWSKEEDKILKKHYPTLGTKANQFLLNRTIDSIEHRARRLGIKYLPTGEGKAGYLDIETNGLQGNWNIMFCWSIKTADKDELFSAVIEREEFENGTLDKRVVKELIETLQQYKRIYTYYGTRFDLPFARTRALANGLKFVPYGLVQHRDLYFLARRILKIHSNRLAVVCDLLKIKGKTHLKPHVWIAANSGNKKALQYILTHNIADVTILEEAHKKLREYEGRTMRYV